MSKRESCHNSATPLLPKKIKQNLRWREEAEIIQLHSYCQQNKIQRTKRESRNYSATPLLSTKQYIQDQERKL